MPDTLVSVIGSVTRAYTLAILSGTRVPTTAYRISALANLSPPNVYVELRRLAQAGVVEKRGKGWVLVDDRVRTFCEGRGPLFERRLSLETKREWSRENRYLIAKLKKRPIPSGEEPSGPEPRLMREFSRSTTKNRLLKAAGLKESRHLHR